MNKHTLIIIPLFIVSVTVTAQKPKVENDPTHDERALHFGFSLGLNTMDYKIALSDYAKQEGVFVDVKDLSPGINIHAIANLRLAEYFDLRTLPGISFGERFIYFRDRNGGLIYGDSTAYKVQSSYIEIPFLLKYKAKRLNNFRPFLIGGANFRYDLSIDKEYKYDEQLFMIEPFDVYGEIGFGMDFYLLFFKFATEIKYSIGLTNILRRFDRHGKIPAEFEEFTNYMDKINSHIVIISFHFE